MSNRTRIGWICNSSIGTSETFLVDNLNMLKGFADVKAFSGNADKQSPNPSVKALDFDDVPQRMHHIIRRKLTGQDVRTLSKRKRCKAQLFKGLQSFNPDVLWIEFGTTAHVASDLIEALGKPYLIAVHGFDITRELRDPWYASEFTRLANGSQGVVCASHHTRNLCRVAGVEEDKCKVIRLPIDGQRFQANPIAQPDPASFVHLGRLVEKKGPLQTLMAFEQVIRDIPNARMTFIGDGPLRPTLEAHIQKANLGHAVTLSGPLPQSEALQLVAKHATFCQHSVTGMDGDQEGFALSPAEAALMEMPVVSTFHNGIPEHVVNGKTGHLVREWDIQGMADAMLQLAKDPIKGKAMGQAGRKNILTLCNPEKREVELKQLITSIS